MLSLVALVDHRVRDAVVARTSGAANAVHVRFADVGDLEVDDVAHPLDVDASGGDVGGHKDLDFAAAKRVHRTVALRLAFVSVDGFAADAVLLQVAHHLVRPVFRPREHERGFHFRPVEHLDQQVAFGALAHEQHALVHRLGCAADPGHLDPDGVGEDGLGQLDDAFRHGCAEEQALTLFRKHGDDTSDVVDEAHVQHGVCLVQDQKLDPFQRQKSLVAQVEEPTGGGHKDVHAFAQLGHLLVLADAPEDEGRSGLDVLGISFDVVVDLGGQFTGWGENQHTRHGFPVHHVVRQVVDDGQRKCCGLACARLGDAHHITALEHVWDGLFLNGGGLLVTERHQGFKHPRVQAHV